MELVEAFRVPLCHFRLSVTLWSGMRQACTYNTIPADRTWETWGVPVNATFQRQVSLHPTRHTQTLCLTLSLPIMSARTLTRARPLSHRSCLSHAPASISSPMYFLACCNMNWTFFPQQRICRRSSGSLLEQPTGSPPMSSRCKTPAPAPPLAQPPFTSPTTSVPQSRSRCVPTTTSVPSSLLTPQFLRASATQLISLRFRRVRYLSMHSIPCASSGLHLLHLFFLGGSCCRHLL